ncbi:MAG: chorismate mutase, partial [Eubacteriales bacterium]
MTDLEKARAEIDACDREMAALFARRMAAVEEVADYKEAAGLPVLDRAREDALLEKNVGYLPDMTYEREYRAFLRAEMAISRGYQSRRRDKLYVDLGDKGYPIVLQSGGIYHAKEYLNLNRRVLIVTDDGVPSQYARTVEAQCATPTRVCIPAGEKSKQ